MQVLDVFSTIFFYIMVYLIVHLVHEIKLLGPVFFKVVLSKSITPPRDSLLQAHFYVLHHIPEVHPFLNEHFDILCAKYPSKGIGH